MYSSYSYNPGLISSGGNSGWAIASIIIAIIGGIVLYFTFLKKGNEGQFTGFKGWLYDFLTFKKMVIENVLRILYLICALWITLGSFSLIGQNFLAFVLTITLGNLLIRIVYEFSLVILIICRNTTELNQKKKKEE